jgi:hypothetical protein
VVTVVAQWVTVVAQWVTVVAQWMTVIAQRVTVIAQWVTVVAQQVKVVVQWAKAPGIHCYVAGSIPAVTPRYCTKKTEKCSLEHTKKQRKKKDLPHLWVESGWAGVIAPHIAGVIG